VRILVATLVVAGCQAPQPFEVFIFVAHDCPVANAYAPEVARLCHDYGPRGVSFKVVYADPDLTPEAARRHAAEYGFPCPTLLDSDFRVVKRTGVTKTPEAAVLDPRGTLLYRGRIDDLFPALGTRRPAPTRRDLREALDAVLDGRPVPVARTEPVGCDLKESP